MTEEEKDRKAYERYRRYQRAKAKADSEDMAGGIIVIVIAMALIAMKFGIH